MTRKRLLAALTAVLVVGASWREHDLPYLQAAELAATLTTWTGTPVRVHGVVHDLVARDIGVLEGREAERT